ncbi:hypothetical protein NQ317_010544 [Molorchus minor]|uniref:Uncharacterized protein n=1 Tax=Molorchus minor TaxID=1323400 RepID=A0ABQ9JPM4_9CUCU|nr:hypothetical protein NQ317_010544 [Molorchus minor]
MLLMYGEFIRSPQSQFAATQNVRIDKCYIKRENLTFDFTLYLQMFDIWSGQLSLGHPQKMDKRLFEGCRR